MALITGSWLLDILIFISALLGSFYLYANHQYQHWKKRKITHTETTFPFGSVKGGISQVTLGVVFKNLYEQFKGEPFFGAWVFFTPTLMVRSPELIKDILVKDFNNFHDRGIYVNEKEDPLAAHLVAIGGNKWRKLRNKLSPTFTSGKMKMMFPILQECSEELKELMGNLLKTEQILEMKDILARFTTDIIASCAFGIQTNSLKNPDAVFRKMGKKLLSPSSITLIKGSLAFFAPNLAKTFKVKTTDQDVEDFFLGAVKETMDYREEKKIQRNDFLQLLIQLMKKGNLDDQENSSAVNEKAENSMKITFLEAAAQALVFYVGGFETSSTTMQFALYELSLNPDVQDKAREEILKVLAEHDGKVTYEAIYKMNYLGRVIDETLRKYPPIPMLQRQCDQDYTIPGTNVTISSGTQILISTFGLHMDPEYFPNPERFDPDRFTEEEKLKRQNYTYLPFGDGPRNCIGMRFGLMQTRVGLATLLSNYRFEVSEKTQVPLAFDPKSIFLSPEKMMYLKVTKIDKK